MFVLHMKWICSQCQDFRLDVGVKLSMHGEPPIGYRQRVE